MKFNLILLLLLSTICFAKTQIELIDIYDGDKVKAKIKKEKFDIRLIWIDCFETAQINRAYKQAYKNNLKIEEVVKQGKSAKKYLESLYENSNKNAYFDFYGIDKYSRALGVLYFDKLNINEELVNKNICPRYKYFSDWFILLNPIVLQLLLHQLFEQECF